MTILLVEQDARVALKHADRGYVLRTGEIVLSGSSEELLANDDVRLIYLGGWQGTQRGEPATEPVDPMRDEGPAVPGDEA